MGNDKKKPFVVFTKYSPYMVVGLDKVTNSKGKEIPLEPVTSLCRCGASKMKPYCDGSHGEAGFVGEKGKDRVSDKVEEYVGKEITIVDNRGVCSHFGACSDNSPKVFREATPWIDPNGASKEEIIETIKKCPSGALSYKIDGVRYQDVDREPAIIITKDGPFHLEGGIELIDDAGNKPECKEHCSLCRCGESTNKPFCDGAHHDNGFEDKDN